jgi:hypothetical protein
MKHRWESMTEEERKPFFDLHQAEKKKLDEKILF